MEWKKGRRSETTACSRMEASGRLLHRNWDLYDTRHVVFRTEAMPAEALQNGYWRAYRNFCRWGAIARGASLAEAGIHAERHIGRADELAHHAAEDIL